MLPYFGLLLMPSVLALRSGGTKKSFSLFFVLIAYAVFVGTRQNVGMDWNNYDYIHTNISSRSLREIFLRPEPLSYGLFWLSAEWGYHMVLSNIAAAVILCGGVFVFAKRTFNPWLAVVAATPYLIIAFGMTGIRQAMAIGVTLFLFAQWNSSNLVWRLFLILVAALFHTSALVLLIFVLADLRLKPSLKITAGFTATAAIFYSVANSSLFSKSAAFYQDAYLGAQSIVSPGALMHMSMVWAPAALYIINHRRLAQHAHDANFTWLGSFGAVLAFPLYLISTTAGSRLILYFFFVPMTVYPAIVRACTPSNRLPTVVLIVLLHFAILAVWLLFANNSFAHLPYSSFLFE